MPRSNLPSLSPVEVAQVSGAGLLSSPLGLPVTTGPQGAARPDFCDQLAPTERQLRLEGAGGLIGTY